MSRIAVMLLLVASLAGCTDAKDGDPQVLFETSLGDFVVELWPDKAPKTVDNFLQYVDDGFYDGLTFHRIMPGFVVQGGGFEPDHQTLRPTRDPIENEASREVSNQKWTLSMARTGDPDSATSQFFINLADNSRSLDPNAQSAGYAVFGKVISGREAIENMTKVTPGRSFGSAGGYYPAEPIIIERAVRTSGVAMEQEPQMPARFDCPAGTPGEGNVVADAITPGVFCITNAQDQVLVWARNFADIPASVEWNLTGADGGPLPEGWTVAFDAPEATLAAARSDGEAAHTMLHITVPAATSGEFPLELRTGNSVTPIDAIVDLRHDRVAKEGDDVNVEYAGRCADDGSAFDDGEFPLTLGGGRAIVGFDRGLIGMGWNEATEIYLPTPLAYGYDSGPCAGDNADLIFEVRLLDL